MFKCQVNIPYIDPMYFRSFKGVKSFHLYLTGPPGITGKIVCTLIFTLELALMLVAGKGRSGHPGGGNLGFEV